MIKLILAAIISYIGLSNACSCFLPDGWQKEFYCRYTFAGTFRVLGPSYACGDELICYDIVGVDQIRGEPETLKVAQTHTQSSMCGTTLQKGHTYFISTTPGDSHNIGVGLCQLLEDWTDDSCDEIKEKLNEYKQINCDGGPAEPYEPYEPKCSRRSSMSCFCGRY